MNETNHPARRLRHGDRPTEPLVFEDAAANKAAEESKLTTSQVIIDEWKAWAFSNSNGDLSRAISQIESAIAVESLYRQDEATTILRDMLAIQDACDLHTDEYAPGSVIEYIKELEAESDSRQVANKADVEPFGWVFDPFNSIQPSFEKGIENPWKASGGAGPVYLMPIPAAQSDRTRHALEAALILCDTDEQRAFFRGEIEALLATPPATTGASTVLTDEQLRDTEGYKLGWMDGMQEGAELATEGEKTAADVEAEFADLLPGSYYMDPPDGGSPSVLEQVSRMAGDAAKWREVAAQAGQVAVPEDVADAKRYRWLRDTCYDTDPAGEGDAWDHPSLHFESSELEPYNSASLDAAIDADMNTNPSPAKESK